MGVPSWFPLSNKHLKNKLYKAQNKCIRVCQDLPPRSLSNPLFFSKVQLMTESNTVLRVPSSNGIGLCQYLFMKGLNLCFVDLAQITDCKDYLS